MNTFRMTLSQGWFLRRSDVAKIAFLVLIFVSAPVSADDFSQLATRQFEPLSANPVLTGHEGHWDAKIRERGWILKESDLWRLWYTGYDPAQQPPKMRLGYATSSDGLTWVRQTNDQPLIEDLWVEDMMVVRQGDEYFMFAEGLNDQAQLLQSTNGVDWTGRGTLDVRLAHGQPNPPGPFGTPTAWFEDGVWNLFYERRDQGIWLARSTDMKVWTNVSDEPVIVPGPEPYDGLMIAMNQVIRQDGRYLAVLHGTGTPQKPREWCTYLAESKDLLTWNKLQKNPLRPVPENKSSGQLVHDGHNWRLYTMHDKIQVHTLKSLAP